MSAALALVWLTACGGSDEPATGTGTSPTTDTATTALPADFDEIDFEQVYTDAVASMFLVTTQAPWQGHLSALETRQPGCPDLWVGGVEDADMTADEGGASWADDCRTEGGLYYDGWAWWDFDASASGDGETAEGRIEEASRVLEGDAVVGVDDEVRFEFKGRADDYTYQVNAADGYQRWIYRTTVEGTVTGSDVFAGTLTPRGWRTDLYLELTGGDVDRIEARGNVYMFEPQIGGRFDSIQVDLDLPGEKGAGPDDCTLEPLGWIGVRTPEAVWYDLVFLPRFTDDIIGEEYPNDPLSECDGCGTLYVGGVEAGEVCIDLASAFASAESAVPPVEEFVLTLHDLP
jgi:hypothetical protein